MAQAAQQAGRKLEEVLLLAVSKTQPPEAIREAFQAGLHDFAENYLQEALDKQPQLTDLALSWHFIGPIQSNKTRPIAENFDWVHSVDRLKIAQRLSEARPSHLPPLNICLQVNVSGEISKSGCLSAEVPELARAASQLPRLRLRGLMAIPAQAVDIEQQRAPFRQLRQLLESLNQQGLALDTLSMGMSEDFPAAIAEGATIVRIGTAIFGPRMRKEQHAD
jgi:pyridoxal phosphate enzyme (YggS family)